MSGYPASQLSGLPRRLELNAGSRIAVIGGGPAGSFFSYFLLEMGRRVGLDLQVDIYESRDFSLPGPSGCNMCGGVISESLVQVLAAEGINLPPTTVQRGIDSYVLHMDVGSVRIEPPLQERRIAVVHRGAGPRGVQAMTWRSFDGYLLELAQAKGAAVRQARVHGVAWNDGRPEVRTREGPLQVYDLLAVAAGVNSATLKLFNGMALPYQPPETTRAYIAEFPLGREALEKHLGHSMHVFLLNIPRLEFAALIPKGEYATLCLLGEEIDAALVRTFMGAPEVRRCLPPDWRPPEDFCRCSPRINVRAAAQPFADRIVFIGDCGVTRLYKDGIGAAYRTAKAAARTAVFYGVSEEDFRQQYWPACRAIARDNTVGRLIFAATRRIRKLRLARRGLLRMVAREQQRPSGRRMSMALWDVFTGSAPYREVFRRMLWPPFWLGWGWNMLAGLRRSKPSGGSMTFLT